MMQQRRRLEEGEEPDPELERAEAEAAAAEEEEKEEQQQQEEEEAAHVSQILRGESHHRKTGRQCLLVNCCSCIQSTATSQVVPRSTRGTSRCCFYCSACSCRTPTSRRRRCSAGVRKSQSLGSPRPSRGFLDLGTSRSASPRHDRVALCTSVSGCHEEASLCHVMPHSARCQRHARPRRPELLVTTTAWHANVL